jgi:sulfite reductase alpha subunit-like flavoprotein
LGSPRGRRRIKVTEEKEAPETETPEETAEAETPQEAAEAEVSEEKTEEEAEEKAEAEKKPKESKKVERYTRHQLQRLTTKKLREIAFELGEVTGVHGMKKDELVDAIFSLRGIETAEDAAEPSVDKSAIKTEILEAGDAIELKRVRKRIKRLKRVLRRAS